MQNLSNDTQRQPRASVDGPRERAGLATPAEAARFLRLSRAMVFKLIGEEKIPVRRFGRAVRIPWIWLRDQAGM